MTRLICTGRIVSFFGAPVQEKQIVCAYCFSDKILTLEENQMGLWELFVLAVGLSMDAFSVAVCKGLSVCQIRKKQILTVGLYFGFFQGFMPLVGYLLGTGFQEKIQSIDHWIAFILLGIIGFNMIRESLNQEEECVDCSVSPGNMILLAIATSIDALAVGVTFAFLQVRIVPAVSFIGSTTFILSIIGVKVGNVFGTKYKSKAEFAGGLILVIMGVKILLEHTLGI